MKQHINFTDTPFYIEEKIVVLERNASEFKNIEKYDIPINTTKLKNIFTCSNVVFYVTDDEIYFSLHKDYSNLDFFKKIGRHISSIFYALILPNNFMENSQIKKITSSITHYAILTESGDVLILGDNYDGQFYYKNNYFTVDKYQFDSEIADVVCRFDKIALLSRKGTVYVAGGGFDRGFKKMELKCKIVKIAATGSGNEIFLLGENNMLYGEGDAIGDNSEIKYVKQFSENIVSNIHTCHRGIYVTTKTGDVYFGECQKENIKFNIHEKFNKKSIISISDNVIEHYVNINDDYIYVCGMSSNPKNIIYKVPKEYKNHDVNIQFKGDNKFITMKQGIKLALYMKNVKYMMRNLRESYCGKKVSDISFVF